MINSASVEKELRKLGNTIRAKHSLRFFKTGKGEYGYGDKFLGVTVPNQRKVAKFFADLPLEEIQKLLKSPFHESRLTALLILVSQHERGDKFSKEKIARFYLKNLGKVNNWDLVDLSAPYILGSYFMDHPRGELYKLAKSPNIWLRRVSIMATFRFIREENKFSDTFKIASILIRDKHDLIHKAVGWMLREVGKKSISAEEKFLEKTAAIMPRTMLRYAIERLPEIKRKYYLSLKS